MPTVECCQAAADTNNNREECGCKTAKKCVIKSAELLKKQTTNGFVANGNTEKLFKPVTHVIFDLDGLLIDSEVRFANAIAILLKRFGIPEYSRELQEKVLGMEVARGIEEIIKQTNLPLSVAEFMVMEREIYTEEMLKVELMPGAFKLVKHLSDHRVPIAIATGSTKESYDIKVARHQDLFEPGRYFSHIVFTRDDPEVKRPKPAPDVYLITASRFANPPDPSKCLVLEDSSIGVDGARAAGMQVVMVPDARFPAHQPNATLILSSLEQFKPELFGLPPYDD